LKTLRTEVITDAVRSAETLFWRRRLSSVAFAGTRPVVS
jgi:hypothetical protein